MGGEDRKGSVFNIKFLFYVSITWICKFVTQIYNSYLLIFKIMFLGNFRILYDVLNVEEYPCRKTERKKEKRNVTLYFKIL